MKNNNLKGSIILFIVGLGLLIYSFPTIINAIIYIKNSGFDDLNTYMEKVEYLTSLFTKGIYIPFGITAIIAGIMKKGSIKLYIYAIIMFVLAITYIVSILTNGSFNITSFIQTILYLFVPILYSIGTFLITFKKK